MPPSTSHETLSGRERVLLALDHQEADRVPIAMVCSGINPPARAALEAHLRATRGVSVDAYLDPLIDIVTVAPEYVGPPLAAGEDIWGVVRAPVSYGDGAYDEIHHYPLGEAETPADLDAHRWPSPDWFDFSVIPGRIRALRAVRDRAVMATNGNLFETSWYMRGFECMLMDLVERPELAHAILRRVTDYYKAFFHRVLSAAPGEIDLVFTADDLGGQRGLLMSLPLWERTIKPYHRELNDLIHDHGARVIYHSDGAIMRAVPGLIDMGIDCLQALQFSAEGMDPVALKEQYGEKLAFEGGVSVQTTLPFGTPQDVADEVRERIRVLGRGGGYIVGPSHTIQAGTPPENVVAMFETARGGAL